MPSYDYRGTALYGYDADGRAFGKSGIASAKLWGSYLNTANGNVYQCVSLGEPDYGYFQTSDKAPASGKTYFSRSRVPDGSWSYSAITTPVWRYFQTSDKAPASGKTYYSRSMASDGSWSYSAITSHYYTWAKTKDKEVAKGKVYATGGYDSAGKWAYSVVSNPKKDDLGSYYERTGYDMSRYYERGYDMSRYYERGYDMSRYYERRVTVAAGSPGKALWKYVRTDIIGRPAQTVSSLCAPRRDENSKSWRSTWKVPAWLTDPKNGRRAQRLEVERGVVVAQGKMTMRVGNYYQTGTGATSAAVNVGSLAADFAERVSGKGSVVYLDEYTRKSFYPVGETPTTGSRTVEPGPKVRSVYVNVRSVNRGEELAGPVAKASVRLERPRKPSVAAPVHDETTGRVTFAVTPGRDSGPRERYDTRYQLSVLDSRTMKKAKVVKDAHPTTNDGFTVAYDVPQRGALAYGQYVKVTLTAWSRGLAGDSAKVSRSIVVGPPGRATIKGVDVPSLSGSAKVTVRISTGNGVTHPVDGVRLQVLRDTEARTAAEADLSGEWEDTKAVDDGSCTALAATVASLMPERGKKTWVRVKTWNDFEDFPGLTRTSAPKRVRALERPAPTAADDEVAVLSAEPGADGASAVLRLGWFEDDSTHTEVSWAASEDAWGSTEPPETFDLDDKAWDEGPATVGGTRYAHTASLVVKGLDEGTPYRFAARRWQKSGDGASYGPYCAKATAMPSAAPTSVALSAPAVLPRGSSAGWSWSYDSAAAQRTWRLMQQLGDAQADGDPVIAEGTDLLGSCVVAWERIAGLLPGDGVLRAYVAVGTGGAEAVSETRPTVVADPPSLSLSVPGTVTAQPLSLPVTCSDPEAAVAVVVSARGCSGERPGGSYAQARGDTVLSEVYAPSWAPDAATGMYAATLDAPPGLVLLDGASYDVAAKAVNPFNGLESDAAEASFSVRWAHRAPAPPDGLAVAPYDVTDGSGSRTIGAVIDLSSWAYAATDDTEPAEGKTYYARDAAYAPTLDESVGEGKAYYARDGESGAYALVAEPSADGLSSYYELSESFAEAEPAGGEDPSAEGWYERVEAPPAGMADTDVYDVYRVTPDGADLVASGCAPGELVDDPYAPFGSADLRYRVAVRTADGDEEWADYGYRLDCSAARFDWPAGHVELGFDIALRDSLPKDGGVRVHMDGTRSAHVGFAGRGGAVGVTVVKLGSAGDVELLRALGRHRGTAFVRLPNGCAYEAVVQVPDISEEGPVSASVQIETEEVDLSSAYRAKGGGR